LGLGFGEAGAGAVVGGMVRLRGEGAGLRDEGVMGLVARAEAKRARDGEGVELVKVYFLRAPLKEGAGFNGASCSSS